MSRAILIVALLIGAAGTARPSQDVYPPLTRETLVGVWEGLFGIGAVPVIFHLSIAPQDSDSYLSEIYADSMRGRLFRLDSCTIAEGKVKLHFRSSDGASWWIEGDGFGNQKRAWIHANFGTDADARRTGPPTFYLEKGTWIRRLGEASIRAAEKIPNIRGGKE